MTVRDLAAPGCRCEIRWRKRIFECRYPLCPTKTWTEHHPAIASRAVLTERARQWAFEQVGRHDRAVAAGRRASSASAGTRSCGRSGAAGNRWSPTTRDDFDGVSAVGVDETAFLRACRTHPTLYATGIADLTPGRPARLLDVVEGRSGAVLSGWLGARDEKFRAQIVTASLDPFRGYATALAAQLPQAVRVLDAFHVVKLALTCVDEVRRRTQQDTLGHRGFAAGPIVPDPPVAASPRGPAHHQATRRAPRGAAGR